MKRCPECRRDYYDETLLYCLDDGNALLDGPRSASADGQSLSEPPALAGGQFGDETQTAILHSADAHGEAPIRAQINTTDQTAILPNRAEAESRESLAGLSEKPRFPANRAAKLLIAVVVSAAVLVGGFVGYRYFTIGSGQIESIAVMPFVNDSGNAEMEYLSDGMTETLISSLSQLPNLNVKARSSVFRYKGKETDPQTIARELNVQAVLNGRVASRGEQLTLSLELVDAQTENVIWSEQFNRKQTDLVLLQNEIARDVSNKLRVKLSGADEQKLTKKYTENNEAYKLYLQGRFNASKRTNKDLEKSIEYFNQAITLDSHYALAYAELANSYALLSNYGGALPRETMPKAKHAAQKALSLDESLAEGHAAFGSILAWYDYDFAGSERAFKRAIELNPNYATAHHYYGNIASAMGNHEEGFALFRRALEIDPLSLIINRAYGDRLLLARRYDEAIAQLKKTLELDAGFVSARYSLAAAYQMKGNYAGCVEELAKHQEQIGESQKAALMRESYAKNSWQGFLRVITENRIRFNSPWDNMAAFYAALGEKDKAIAELNRSYENREVYLIMLKVDPRYDPLRDDPRFKDLLKQMNFTD